MTMLDMRDAARDQGMTLDRGALTDAEREVAVVTWRGRMVNEHVSARVFAGLVPQMMAAGVDVRLQLEVASMIQEELRHGVLCAAAVEALGGEARATLPKLQSVPSHDDCGALESLLRNVLSVCCLSETVAVALITAERLETRPAELQTALTEILGDEVGHARFGWRLLDELAPRIDEALRHRLGDYLPVAFLHLLHYELTHLPVQPTPPSEIMEAYGVCNGRDARALFYDTITSVIVPELQARGLPGESAWAVARAEYEAGPKDIP
jgi:hypothetical protein